MRGSGEGAPPAAARVVARPSLFARLSAAEGRVVLLSAPAGSGKTVVLRSWLEAAGLSSRAAWVTVEPAERDPQQLWLHVAAALRNIRPAGPVVDLLTPTPEFDGRAFIDRLIADLAELDAPVILVIDDLHELASAEAQAQLERLVARRPAQLRLIFATRHDPQLGLHRLRLSGDLVELRNADLLFSPGEAAELLAASGVPLSDETAARLQARTEGWAAALRLAALSLVGHRDPERFIADFSGSERTVADYLLAEVLERQPEDVRTLLLRTSILDRVSGPLADRILGTSGSERILLGLEASNAFVTATDPDRRWFRYHQLFSDLLRLELRRTSPELLPELHEAAAGWFAEHGLVIDAVRHHQLAGKWVAAAELLAEQGFGLVLDGQGGAIDGLLAAFPPEAFDDATLLALRALRELSERSLDTAAEYLALAGRRAAAASPESRRPVDLALALVRLALARRRGDLETALREVAPFLEPLDAPGPRELALEGAARATSLMNLGIVELWSSRFDDGQRHLEQALALARQVERPFVEIGALSHLALLASTHSFALARPRAEQALALAEAHGWAANPISGVALATIASMDAAQGRFDDARRWLDRAGPLLRPEVDPAGALLVHFARGDLLAGEGRISEAIEEVRAGEALQAVLATPHVLTGPARDVLVLAQVRGGDLAAARATLAGLSDADRGRAEARLAAAALNVADGDPEAAIARLTDVLTGAIPVLRAGTMIQTLVVAAAAHDQLGHVSTANELVERALDVAEPDGLLLPFLTTPTADLLERHPRDETAHGALLSDLLDLLHGSAPAGRRAAVDAPVEALSPSELRVLRYLPSNLSASEIAAELYVSTSTVKTHMRHVYDKLAAHRRTEAVDRARALGLLGPSVPRRG